jgi:Tol biopolymer transport system component
VKLRYSIVAVAIAAVVFAAVAVAGGGGPQTKLVSRASDGDPASGGSSFPGGITPDARWVVFSSEANNLPGAPTGDSQIYVRNRKTGKTSLVTRSNNGDPADGDSFDATISDNGRYVAFESNATNLPGEISPDPQVYVRDRKKGRTELISRLSGGDPATGGFSTDPSISGNGRHVAFESDATNLPGSLSPDDQVYLRDRKAKRTTLVSKTNGGTPADDDSEDAAISPNGRIIGFESEASNLPGGLGTDDQVYVRDLRGGRTLLVSRNTAGDPADDDSEEVAVSRSGRFVAFESAATNLPGSIGPTYRQTYRRDRKRDRTILISRNNAGDPAAGGYNEEPSVSANGRFVQFESLATNLPGATGTYAMIYLRDTDAERTKLVSRSNSGDPANQFSGMLRNSNLISRDPRFATFNSFATNLPGVTPPYSQAFIRGPRP